MLELGKRLPPGNASRRRICARRRDTVLAYLQPGPLRVHIEIAQQDLGHASLATTTVTIEAKRRMKAVSAFWGKRL